MHLDLKPENMMYFRELGGAEILKTIDFGSSKLLKHAEVSPANEQENRANLCRNIGEPVGTKEYLSPEIRYKCAALSWEQSAEYYLSNVHPLKVNLCNKFNNFK
jgi:serine/threonine protein kinase